MAGDNLKFRANGQRECRQCSRDRAAAIRRDKGVPARRGPDCDYQTPPHPGGYRKGAPVETIKPDLVYEKTEE